jgi:hypothetical protein
MFNANLTNAKVSYAIMGVPYATLNNTVWNGATGCSTVYPAGMLDGKPYGVGCLN